VYRIGHYEQSNTLKYIRFLLVK